MAHRPDGGRGCSGWVGVCEQGRDGLPGVLQLLHRHGHLVSPSSVPVSAQKSSCPTPGAAVHTRLSLNHTQWVPECHGHLGDGVLETPAELEPGRAHSALPALPAAVLGGCVGTLAKHQ